jgi:hypothetical protein
MSIIVDHPGAAAAVNKTVEVPSVIQVHPGMVNPEPVIINPNVEVTASHLAPMQIHV